MKSKFSWYFPPDEKELSEIWKKGQLTIDANVLLDLYRYHENTRNSLISALETFKGRLWLSHQAATEFFRNRNKVIFSANKGFKQASDEILKIRRAAQSSADQLKGNRIIPAEISDALIKALELALDNSDKSINEAGNAFPDYLNNDPIMDNLVLMFDDAIGESFKEEDLKSLRIEAEARKKKNIPPGYLDEDKDGDRPYGDFFLWRQILEYSKNTKSPVIFVTSERKDDWWEKHSGQIISPRQELLKEAHDYTGQRVIVYQTDRFLHFVAEHTGSKIDQSAVEEIQEVASIRAGATNAVNVLSQVAETSTPLLNKGVFTIELKRPLFRFTASGHFHPQLANTPTLNVRLIESPGDMPSHKFWSGTGTNHDFNIHLKSYDYGVHLPVGKYAFEYIAIVGHEQPSEDSLE